MFPLSVLFPFNFGGGGLLSIKRSRGMKIG